LRGGDFAANKQKVAQIIRKTRFSCDKLRIDKTESVSYVGGVMAINTLQVKCKKISRYLPRLKILSVVVQCVAGKHVLTIRQKKRLTKRLERKLT
jgi:hypothetical protein